MTLSESTMSEAITAAMADPQARTLLKLDRALRSRNIQCYLGFRLGGGAALLRFATSAGERHVHIGINGALAGGISIEELAGDALQQTGTSSAQQA
jgi:hypothetical protein